MQIWVKCRYCKRNQRKHTRQGRTFKCKYCQEWQPGPGVDPSVLVREAARERGFAELRARRGSEGNGDAETSGNAVRPAPPGPTSPTPPSAPRPRKRIIRTAPAPAADEGGETLAAGGGDPSADEPEGERIRGGDRADAAGVRSPHPPARPWWHGALYGGSE